MIFAYILKIIADLSFYFTFANFIAVVFRLPSVILFLPPAFYVIYSFITIIKRNRSSKSSGQFTHNQIVYEGVFTLYLKLFIPFAFVMILLASPYFETASLPFAITFFTSAIILMRMMRQQPQIRKQLRFQLLNMFPVVCILLMSIAITSRQFLGIGGALLSGIYFNVIAPILLALGVIIAFILSPLFWILSPLVQDGPPVQGGYADGYDYSEVEIIPWHPVLVEALRAVVIVAAAMLAVYLLVKLFKKLTEQQLFTASGGGIIQKYISLDERKPAKDRSSGPIGQVRKYYRRFLRLCWKNGIPGEMHMTSADYESLSTARFNLGDEAVEFRDIYVAARYGGKEVTQKDIASVKKLYQRIRRAGKARSED